MPIAQSHDLARQGDLNVVEGFSQLTQGQPYGFGTVDAFPWGGQQIGGIAFTRCRQSRVQLAAACLNERDPDLSVAVGIAAQVDLGLLPRNHSRLSAEESPRRHEERTTMFEDGTGSAGP